MSNYDKLIEVEDIILVSEDISYKKLSVKDDSYATDYSDRELRYKDYYASFSEIINYKEHKYLEVIELSLDYYDIINKNLSEVMESYFPDYFHEQEPYSSLIDALTSKFSYSYAISDYIKLVYDTDSLPYDPKYYNSLLRLIGINYDFSDYPPYLLKSVIKNYLSIRKHRGTKNSILAVLRSMDPKYLEDPNNQCDVEIEYYDNYPIVGNITIDKSGILEIYYNNIPYDHYKYINYMLSKVIPTGLAYKLYHKKIRVQDNTIELIDRFYLEESSVYQYRVSDILYSRSYLKGREFFTKDISNIIDIRETDNKTDIEYFSEKLQIILRVIDRVGFAEDAIRNINLKYEDSAVLSEKEWYDSDHNKHYAIVSEAEYKYHSDTVIFDEYDIDTSDNYYPYIRKIDTNNPLLYKKLIKEDYIEFSKDDVPYTLVSTYDSIYTDYVPTSIDKSLTTINVRDYIYINNDENSSVSKYGQ